MNHRINRELRRWLLATPRTTLRDQLLTTDYGSHGGVANLGNCHIWIVGCRFKEVTRFDHGMIKRLLNELFAIKEPGSLSSAKYYRRIIES